MQRVGGVVQFEAALKGHGFTVAGFGAWNTGVC